MATGKKNTPLILTANQNPYDLLFNDLVTINQEIHKVASELNYEVASHSYDSLTQFVFILNNNYKILSFNYEALDFLRESANMLKYKAFKKIVAPSSLEEWQSLIKNKLPLPKQSIRRMLTLQSKNKTLYFASCNLSRLAYKNQIVITSIVAIDPPQNLLNQEWKIKYAKDPHSKEVIIRLYEYIMNHLDLPLPPLKQIAKELASEEHILRTGFKSLFGSSIYNFYQMERLKKAELLIVQTEIPLKEIAFMCGFNSYFSFYKAFTKKYRFPPTNLLRFFKNKE